MKALFQNGAVALCLLTTACAGEPLQFADWTIPVPEGTPVIEYAAVPMEDRNERIELVEDLVIGREEDPNFRFYAVLDLDVDPQGQIYVLDAGNHRIQVFSAQGEFVRTIGREGYGPGEIGRGGRIAIWGNRLSFAGEGSLHTWDLDGQHLQTRAFRFSRSLFPIAGTDGGSLVSRHASNVG